MKSLDLFDSPIKFEGAMSVDRVPDGVVPRRLPTELLPLIHPDLHGTSLVGTGVRISLDSTTRNLVLVCTSDVTEHAFLDLVINGRRFKTRELQPPGRHELRFADLPPGSKRIELYLPNYGKTVIQQLMVDDDAVQSPWSDSRPRWITYGSSLTHCRRATSPSRAWPAMVANAMGWHLTCLGFGGQCMMDPMLARVIGGSPADVLSICLGINTYGDAYSPRTWSAAAMGFILTLRDKHPITPLVVFSPMISPPRETTPGRTGLTLSLMREWLAGIVAELAARGDRHIAYVDGLEVFGEADVHMLPDQLHPGGDGIELMGRRIEKIFREKLGPVGGGHLMNSSR